MMQDDIYTNRDLTALYDALNPARDDTEFYLHIAGPAKRILDLGCGTGLLACMLSARGHNVTGVEPAGEMLDIARHRKGGGGVTWIEGDARLLKLEQSFDLVIMTGHVFQVFLTDDDVRAVFKTAFEHLGKGGRLIFESRNPLAKAWEDWTPERTGKTISVEGVGEVTVQHRLISVDADLVSFATDHTFHRTGKTIVNGSTLRFLLQTEIEQRLYAAGFSKTIWYGDWHQGPVQTTSQELIVVAERN